MQIMLADHKTLNVNLKEFIFRLSSKLKQTDDIPFSYFLFSCVEVTNVPTQHENAVIKLWDGCQSVDHHFKHLVLVPFVPFSIIRSAVKPKTVRSEGHSSVVNTDFCFCTL